MSEHAVFISYRRDDTADAAGRIYDRLASAFGRESVFKDVDTLQPGESFGSRIATVLNQCRVVLVLIGPGWVEARSADGSRRLDDDLDWVRLEIDAALRAPSVQVVPVLVNGAAMPARASMPSALHELANLNAAHVRRDPDFHKDMDRLIGALREGALTGLVVVEAASPAAMVWATLQLSEDVDDLMRFAERFPGTVEGLEAHRRADRLKVEHRAWNSVNWSSEGSIQDFLAMNPQHSRVDQASAALSELAQSNVENARRVEAENQRWREEQLQRHARQKADVDRVLGKFVVLPLFLAVAGLMAWIVLMGLQS